MITNKTKKTTKIIWILEWNFFLFCLFCKFGVFPFFMNFFGICRFDLMKCIWPTGEANELANSARFIPIDAKRRKKIQSDRKFLLFIIKFQWQRIFPFDVVVGPPFVYNNHKRVFMILCLGHFPVEFRVWIECLFFLFFWSKNKMKTDQMWWCHAGWMECRLYDSRVERKRVTSSLFEGRPFERGNG